MKILIPTYLILFTLLFCGCQGTTDRTFPGKYALSGDTIKDSITLNKNYTYQHKFIDSTNKVYLDSGKWHMNFNKTVIVLDDFSFYNNRGRLSHDTWNAFIEFDRGVKIVYSADDDIYYFKKRKVE